MIEYYQFYRCTTGSLQASDTAAESEVALLSHSRGCRPLG